MMEDLRRNVDDVTDMLMGEMRVLWQGREYRFHKYKIMESDHQDTVVWQNQDLVIYREGRQITLKKPKQS